MGIAIDIKELTKRYGKKTVALDQQNLVLEDGEFLALLGPSGCGKTTLLRSIAGLEEPDEGEITLCGRTVFNHRRGINVPPAQRQVGMVFQSYALWPHMTVYDNVGFGLALQKVPRDQIRRRVDEVLHHLSMGDLGNRYPFELSGGQQQRVALARLLATKPPLFLMDEPLSNLDARLRLDMRSEIKRLHYDSKATTVYVTHDQAEAMTLATKVAVMRNGRIQQIASPSEIYRRPATLFVAEFVGMPHINLVRAHVVQDGDRTWLDAGVFDLPLTWEPAQPEDIVAIRPEDIRLAPPPDDGGSVFRVYAVLSAGPEVFAHLRCGETTLVVRESHQCTLDMDQPVGVTIDLAALNLYDPNSGVLLSEANDTVGERPATIPNPAVVGAFRASGAL